MFFVGRRRERADAATAFAGPGRLVLVSGEAGVGKSALVRVARAAPATDVLLGGCLLIAGEPLPLVALEQALAGRGGWPQVPSVDRFAALRAWADLVAAPAGPATTLVIEDLQWADQTTCDLLVLLAGTLSARPLSMVLTLRTDQEPVGPYVNSAWAQLERMSATRIRLERLDADESRELAESLVGTAGQDQVDSWCRRADGSPLVLTELAGDPSGTALSEVLLAGYLALPDDAAHLVRLAAVSGDPVADELLSAAWPADRGDFAAAVRAAVAGGVLTGDGPGYAFRHGLIREAVLGRLLPAELKPLHRRVAEALETGGRRDPLTVAALSLHWLAAGDRALAATWAREAARTSWRVQAYTEAWAQWQRLLDLEPTVSLDTALEAAAAARMAGHPELAAGLLASALEHMQADEGRRILAFERLGAYRWEAGEPTESAVAYGRAADLLSGDPTSVHALVWAAQARSALVMAGYSAAVALAGAAVAAARVHGPDAVLADALTTLGTAGALLGDLAGPALLEESLALARRSGDEAALCRSYANLIVVHEYGGRPEEACRTALEGLRQLSQHSLELPLGAALACNATNMLIRRGRFAECAEVLERLCDGRSLTGQALHLYLERTHLLLATGDLGGARESLAQAAPLGDVDEPAVVSGLAEATAEVLRQEGDFDGCHAVVDEALRRLEGNEDRHFRLTLVTIALAAEADRRSTGTVDRAAAHARIARLAAMLPAPSPDDDLNFAAELATARQELDRARGTDRPQDWATAAELWQRADRPRERAYCLLRQAEAAASGQQRWQTATIATQAWELATSLGAQPIADAVDALLSRTGLVRVAATEPAAGVELPELTAREREVLWLVGEGLTNRQIATRLVMSDRTVGVHVSHLLRKLGVANRVQAAAVAARVRSTST